MQRKYFYNPTNKAKDKLKKKGETQEEDSIYYFISIRHKIKKKSLFLESI